MRNDSSGMAHQRSQQPILDRREMNRRSVARDTPLRQINRDRAKPYQRRLLMPATITPSELRTNSREQLRHTERLGEIVVRARIQRCNLGIFVGPRGEHDHRLLGPGAQFTNDIDAVGVRQAKVNDNEIGQTKSGFTQALLSCFRLKHGHALRFQRAPYETADLLVVFNDNNGQSGLTHGVSDSAAASGPSPLSSGSASKGGV